MSKEPAAVENEDVEAKERLLWQSCSLPADQRETWLALDDALAAATPPAGRKPTEEELRSLRAAKSACDEFFEGLTQDVCAELQEIADLRKKFRKQARQAAEKQEKKARKAAARHAQSSVEGGEGRNGTRMETHPPTVLEGFCEAMSDNPLQTPALEASHVHHVYDSIADHWSHTRYKAWPRVDEFIRSLPRGSLVADLGCGNGKNIPTIVESGGYAVASDICGPLVNIVAEAHGDVALVADCLCSNLRSGVFDAAISIAVLHHLSTEPRRLQALREGARVLRPGGMFLVYCWSFEQDDERSKSHHRFPGQDVLVPWNFRSPGIKKDDGETNGNQNSTEDWHEAPEVFQRYCHVYREGELAGLFEQVPELEVVDQWFDSGNWCAVGRRR